ncbi:MAG: hypothetical protein JWP12_750 [Bacteroidetes bacterium]|nr:hypothetical protein [Bacteroidota bacterium]
MKKITITFIILYGISFTGLAQFEKGTTQTGASALPVFDVLNIAPHNSISGFGGKANVSFFPVKNLSIGLSPFAAEVKNGYTYTTSLSSLKKEETIKLFGLGMCLRYYVLLNKKFTIYPEFDLGFGNLNTRTSTEGHSKIKERNTSILVGSLGIGANYFLTEKVALELNVTYLTVNEFANRPENFKTIAPTIGVQFFFQ